MSAPLAIVNFKDTSDPVATIRYNANPKKVVATYDGLGTGVAVGSSKELADLLLAGHHNKRAKRVCRTAVLSVKTPRRATKEQLEDIDRRLLQAAADLKLILGVASMLGWVHGNTITRHLHLIFPNSTGRRTLDLRPKFLRQLQAFEWTLALASGRGRGRRRALSVYPKSRKLAVRDLAQVLVDGKGNLRKDRWDAMVKSGQISDFRRRNDGSLISFQWGNKRVRVATLRGFAIEQNTRPEYEHIYEPKLASNTLSLVHQLNHCSDQTHNLNQAQFRLSSLSRQDKDNRGLYQLLSQQNQSLVERLAWLQTSWNRPAPAGPASMPWLQAELQSLAQLVKIHCQLVAWLFQGNDDSNGGPVNNLPLPKSPQPQPQRPASSASPGPVSVDFN